MNTKNKTSKIPTYPEFVCINISHLKEVDEIMSNFEPYADFTFINLFTWSVDDRTELSILHGNLIVRLPDYLTGELIYSIIGSHHIDDCISILLDNAGTLNLVPQIVVDNIKNKSKYVITEDRDGHDYIYSVERLCELSGKGLKNKRNKLNKFKLLYDGHISHQIVKKIDPDTVNELKETFIEWAFENDKSVKAYSAESVALDRLFANLDLIDVRITIVRIDDKICAFSVNEVLTGGLAICHFEKALTTFEGAYTYVINTAAIDLRSQGCEIVNWEQDLGLPGLRRAKSSYQPSGMLKKFTLTKK